MEQATEKERPMQYFMDSGAIASESPENFDLFGAVEEIIRHRGAATPLAKEAPPVCAEEILAEGERYLALLHHLVLKSSDLVRGEGNLQGHAHLVELVQGVAWFVRVVETVGSVLQIDLAKVRLQGKLLATAADELQQMVAEALTCQGEGDWRSLPSLLAEKVAPELEFWKDAFVMLRRL